MHRSNVRRERVASLFSVALLLALFTCVLWARAAHAQPVDAREAAKEWRDGLLIVVGGDGTISEVVNGLGQAGFPEAVTLAILPAGTGNDLAATLAIPEDPDEARSRVEGYVI